MDILQRVIRKLKRIILKSISRFYIFFNPHVGGHQQISNVDFRMLYYLVKKYNIKSMVDIGCGLGEMVKAGKRMGIKAYGIDGDLTTKLYNNEIIVHDFKKKYKRDKNYDLGWSVEFAEHVDEKYIDNFFEVYAKCKYLIFSSPKKGTPGHHHVNCQNSTYWIKYFKKYGFILDKKETNFIRKISIMNNHKAPSKNFIKINGLFFKKII